MIFNKGTHIKVDGELYLNGNHNNFSAIVTNPNTSLEIFNMDPNNVSDNEYLQAFDQFLSSPETSLKIQLNQHFKISNPDKAITHLIQYRLNELKAYEPSSKEIPYLSNLLSDVSTSKISVSLAQRVQSGSNFIYTFTTLIETDTISYKIPYTFESKQLNNAELTEEINKILTTGNNFNFSAVYSTSAMNAATHIINSSTNVEYNNNVTK